MKNVIYTYYNILVYDINKDKNNYFFYYNNELYIFYEVLNNIKIVENIYDFVIKTSIESYKIVLNKDKSLVTNVNNKNYALLRIEGILKYEVKLNEFKFYPINKEPYNWGELWGERLDYYEIQLRELGINYQTVLNSYGFFSGLAENAILYFNLTKNNFNDESIVGIVHNRMKYPCYLIDYNNPLNFVIDYNVRDISEYIKAYMLSKDYDLNNVLIALENLNLNNLMFNLLYSRLLYPTFYFDIYDRIILDDGVDNDILVAIEGVDRYLDMLNKIYLKFKNKYNMLNIEWLNKNVDN